MRDVSKRIGGRAVVDSVVDRFYDYMLTDDRVKQFFTNVNTDKPRQRQKDFIAYALGGSTKYEGKDLRSAHQHLVDRFDATVENLVTAMRDLNVPGDLTEEAGNILESTRNEVLCR